MKQVQDDGEKKILRLRSRRRQGYGGQAGWRGYFLSNSSRSLRILPSTDRKAPMASAKAKKIMA